MHVLVLINLLKCLIFTIFEVAGTPLRTWCWRHWYQQHSPRWNLRLLEECKYMGYDWILFELFKFLTVHSFIEIANVNIIFKLADARRIWRGAPNWWKRSLLWWRYVPGRGKYITTCYFFSTYYSIHSNPCLTMVTLYECRRHHRSLHHLFGMDLPVVQT